ncbi:SAUR-like auxin-responsive protein family [Actinidia rufa]|uniref:SAUR-like auxin-responsive protein family n=1 Tax=Actinidia rufa TaxID=165716 RepID=A0A7J0H0E2_9ERIC|nr:SAUR-like auxin-responsive protein family [Actinidia rufa]
MRKTRGFKLGRKLVKVFSWAIRRKTTPYAEAMSKLCNLGRSLKQGAKGLCFPNSKPGYIRVGQDPIEAKPASVPKGQLAVYVGEREDDAHRFFVPVIYFNHPLFGDLLREAEEEYGYDHPGRIQIPCRVSEFEKVKTRIAASGSGCGSGRRRRSWKLRCLSG